MDTYATKQGSVSAVAWIALIIAIFSLVLAWAAYNRAGRDLEEQINTSVEASTATLQYQYNVLQTQTRLAAIRAQISAQENLEEVPEELADVRQDLRRAADAAGQTVAVQAQEIDQQLEILENEVRENSANALSTLDNIIKQLEQDVRTDE